MLVLWSVGRPGTPVKLIAGQFRTERRSERRFTSGVPELPTTFELVVVESEPRVVSRRCHTKVERPAGPCAALGSARLGGEIKIGAIPGRA
jgi:hypothetical protein